MFSPLNLKGYPNLPDPEIDILAWVQAVDRVAKRRFDPSLPLEPDQRRQLPDQFFEQALTEDAIREIVDARRFICTSQFQISVRATQLFTEQELEQRWTAKSQSERRTLFLDAFKTLATDPMMTFISLTGDEPFSCPELCLETLERDNGRGFLELLKRFLLDNNEELPKHPFILQNAMFDRIIGYTSTATLSKGKEGMLSIKRLSRTYRIMTFIKLVLAAYEGHKIKYIPMAHEHSKTKEVLEKMKPVVTEALGPSAGKQFVKEAAKLRKEMKLFCDHCLKPEDKTESGKMSSCSRCRTIGREVRYCSRDCQKAAWKIHKSQCGKPLDMSAISEDASTLNMSGMRLLPHRADISPPVAGYKRSPHLLRLIRYLNEHPKIDYMIFEASDDPREPILDTISLDEIAGASCFIVMRNRAMCSGDEGGILYVYRVLQNIGAESNIRKQLKQEYGAAWDSLSATLRAGKQPPIKEISREEVEAALSHLRSSGRFKELEGFKSGEGDTKTLALQVGPMKDVTVTVDFPASALPIMCNLVPAKMPELKKKKPDGKGPNFALPKPTDREGYVRYAGLDVQIAWLQANENADYIIFDIERAPNTPHAVVFGDPLDCLAFHGFRHRLFEHGGYDFDALVYLYMTLDQATRRKKVPKEALIRQLRREYGDRYMDMMLDSVKGDVYHRRDGRVISRSQIPVTGSAWKSMIPMIMEHRFGVKIPPKDPGSGSSSAYDGNLDLD